MRLIQRFNRSKRFRYFGILRGIWFLLRSLCFLWSKFVIRSKIVLRSNLLLFWFLILKILNIIIKNLIIFFRTHIDCCFDRWGFPRASACKSVIILFLLRDNRLSRLAFLNYWKIIFLRFGVENRLLLNNRKLIFRLLVFSFGNLIWLLWFITRYWQIKLIVLFWVSICALLQRCGGLLLNGCFIIKEISIKFII